MCVIIARNPNVDIDPDMISSACHVNPDGFGMSIVDRGKITTIRQLKSDEKSITKLLEEAKDKKVFLHLRYRTHGTLSLDNIHPFESFKKDGKSILFMHNGIINDFTSQTDKESDTARFNNTIVKPMIERWVAAGNEPEKIFDDQLFITIMNKYSSGSKFVLFDEEDNQIIFNKQNGKEYEGWWASNTYSFDRAHREQKHYYYGSNGGSRSGYWNGGKWESWDEYEDKAFDTKGNQTNSKKEEVKKPETSNVKALPKPDPAGKVTIPPPSRRPTFCELAGLEDLSTVMFLAEEDIKELIANYPDYSATLIMDLIDALYVKSEVKGNAA